MRMKNVVLDSLLTDYHWSLIRSFRRRARRLIDLGTPCSDLRLVNLSNRILRHGICISRLCRGDRHGVRPAITEDIGDEITA